MSPVFDDLEDGTYSAIQDLDWNESNVSGNASSSSGEATSDWEISADEIEDMIAGTPRGEVLGSIWNVN